MRALHSFVRPSLAVVACLLALPAATGSAATLPTSAAGARSVRMTISLHTELQCGWLMGGPLVVTLPRAVRVPASIDATAVLVGTRAARSVTVAGHVVTIALPLPRGAICDSIEPGVVTIVFTRAAGLGKPKSPGTYTVKLRHGSQRFAAALKID